MFQTEINHFFQSFAFDELTAFMQLITALGYLEFFMGFLIILLLGIDFKKAFVLFMVLMWTAAITFFFKDYFNLPRPFHVDNTIKLFDKKLPDNAVFNFSKRGARGFIGKLDDDVLATTRQAEGLQNGFPSGHSSIAIAFWGAIILLFRKKWVTAIAVALMILIPISRLYLGVHFLADVLGGITLGAIILGVFYQIILKPQKLQAYLQRDHYSFGLNTPTTLLILPPLLLLLILSEEVYILLAFMLGFGLGFLLLAQKGLPSSEGTVVERIGRTVLGALIFAGVGFVLSQIAEKTGLEDVVWFDFLRNMLSGLALIWLGTVLSIRLGWFRRSLQV